MDVDDPIPQVDWDNLQIVESHDEEGRIELLSENQISVFLGSIYACVRWTHLYSAYGFGCELILFSIYEFVWQTYACMYSNYIAHLIVFFSKTDQMHAQ